MHELPVPGFKWLSAERVPFGVGPADEPGHHAPIGADEARRSRAIRRNGEGGCPVMWGDIHRDLPRHRPAKTCPQSLETSLARSALPRLSPRSTLIAGC